MLSLFLGSRWCIGVWIPGPSGSILVGAVRRACVEVRTLYAAWFSLGSILWVRERGSEISIAAYRGEAIDGIVNIDAFGNR